MHKFVLWWGRFDPDYSRNRILRQTLQTLGWEIRDFHPRLSRLGDVEARLRRLPRPDLVWVPSFRQRDLAAARRWSRRHDLPLLADPLISAWDKQVFERAKFSAASPQARRLQQWESVLLQSADLVLADTPAHAAFFADQLGVAQDRLQVVYVSAEQPLFSDSPLAPAPDGTPLEILFFGSFIGLQGVADIIRAARLCQDAPLHWRLIGNGPELASCQRLAEGLGNVVFQPWVPYRELPRHIHRADLVLGIFGSSEKAGRVIPNKVFQALACGRPVVTRRAEAYPAALLAQEGNGVIWVPPGDPDALAQAVSGLAAQRGKLPVLAAQARATFDAWFSPACIASQLSQALARLSL